MAKVLPVSTKKKLTKLEIAEAIPYPEDSPRPSEMKLSDCCYPGAPRPCPLVSCRKNNYLTVTPSGSILLTWPDRQPEDVPPKDSCSEDVANRGQTERHPLILEELAVVMGQKSRQAMDLELKKAQEAFKHAWRNR